MHALSTQPVLPLYSEPGFDVVVSEQPDGRPAGPAVVLRDAQVVVLPLRWGDDNDLEVLLGEYERDAVGGFPVIEAVTVRLANREPDPFLAVREQLGGPADDQHTILLDVLAAPDYSSERWHVLACFNMHGVETKVRRPQWRRLRNWVGDINTGLVRDAKTIVALAMMQVHFAERAAQERRER